MDRKDLSLLLVVNFFSIFFMLIITLGVRSVVMGFTGTFPNQILYISSLLCLFVLALVNYKVLEGRQIFRRRNLIISVLCAMVIWGTSYWFFTHLQ
jgi:hypothetical protein